jgi:UDP-3-O-[3-hydroxymyristoyl] glucosamine N-acyltransferase
MSHYSVQQIAQHVGATTVEDDVFANLIVTGVNTLTSASPDQISFFTNTKYKSDLTTTHAGAVLISEKHKDLIPDRAIVVANPHAAFAYIAQLFDTTPRVSNGIATNASIANTAMIGKNVSIGPNAVIGEHAKIGDGSQIGANVVINECTELGENTQIYPNTTIHHHVRIGSNVVIQANTIIGSDGFGFANEKGQWIPIPQTGSVIIGDDTHIGAGCTIDRGALEDTVIGYNVIIDNQVHIAHNCVIGDHACICGATGMAGSCNIGKYVVIAGSCAINGHITIADGVQITGFSMVTSDITEPGVYSSGQPATPNREWRKNTIRARQLDDLFARVKRLEKE